MWFAEPTQLEDDTEQPEGNRQHTLSIGVDHFQITADHGSLVDRDDELTRLSGLLFDPKVRLLTLTGPGGVGKSRLAAVALRELPRRDRSYVGATVVDLAAASDADDVMKAVASALGISDTPPEPELLGQLLTAVASRRLTLLLDNCEPVVAEVAGLAQVLLARCGGVRLVVTSRERLQLPGEQLLPVTPLAVPAPDVVTSEELGGPVASVRLFLARARAARPGLAPLDPDDWKAVAEICRLLDGLPLALELAAGRVRLFEPRVVLRSGRDFARQEWPFGQFR